MEIHTLNSYNIALRAVFGFQYLAQGHFDTLAVEARTQTTGLSISRWPDFSLSHSRPSSTPNQVPSAKSMNHNDFGNYFFFPNNLSLALRMIKHVFGVRESYLVMTFVIIWAFV